MVGSVSRVRASLIIDHRISGAEIFDFRIIAGRKGKEKHFVRLSVSTGDGSVKERVTCVF
jgi:hypothetical protein